MPRDGGDWIGLVSWVVGSFAAGAIGGFASTRAPEFYRSLNRPPWAPPPAVFGPVWTTLYLLMGIAAWLVWREAGWADGRSALILFIVQLALNALWTWLFFVWHRGALASAEIALLVLVVLWTTVLFWRIRPIAGALLLPYLAWISFATALSYSIWRRNPTVL